ncbi:DUF3520 domain-containing protein [Aerophototrophica crusticola]|uniref:DUF3520 domain-containing protein n=1 Tax=Aerophototrophica crusticola TaxID=1709002 RepID=A0A858R847_9PROT|nr:DUF3520 domain-containing protein [Rhodospirillaceae bacterium B3]
MKRLNKGSVFLLLGGVALVAVGCAPMKPADQEIGGLAPEPVPTMAPPPPTPPPPLPSAPPPGYAPAARMAMARPPVPVQQGDSYQAVEENAVKAVAEAPVSTFSVDVDTASYANIRRFLEQGSLPPPDAVRVEEVVNYFRYDYPVSKVKAKPFNPVVAVYPSPWRQGAEIVHVGLAAYDVPAEARPPANLVFLVDVSGSMDAPDRLPLVKRSLRMMLDGLRDDDRIALVTYAGESRTILPLTPGKDRALIADAIDKLGAGGGTGGQGGLTAAYALAEGAAGEGRVSRVILATDGDFNLGISDPKKLAEFVAGYREKGVALTVLGVGRGNYRDDVAQALAQAGNGQAVYVDTLHEARRALREQLGGTLLTVANDVKIQVEFNPARVAEYRLIGYETRMLRNQDFNDDKVDAGDVGAGHRVTALYEIVAPDSKARLLDPSRYQPEGKGKAAPAGAGNEIAFLKLRWKAPGAKDSQLVTRPITSKDRVPSLDQAGTEVRFAAAAAAYGQKLRGSSFVKDYPWVAVEALASGARGTDPNGERAEFLRLVKLAGALDKR